MRVPVVLLLVCSLAACGGEDTPRTDTPQESPFVHPIEINTTQPLSEDARIANDERFHKQLLSIAAGYQEFGNIDDLMRWAPGLCRVPSVKIRESASDDDGTHGRKLYWLYAKDRPGYYLAAKGAQQGVGQVLVKEAYVAEPGKAESDGKLKLGHQPLIMTVERDGKPYHAGSKQALYVMMKLDPKTEGTDEGWVYGTLTPDGKTVTSAGKVASCMECHTGEGTSDRMFGLPAR